MKVIDESRFALLCEAGEIVQTGCTFLDGMKIGLHINDTILKAPDVIDSSSRDSAIWTPLGLAETTLQRGQFFLATTVECIAISNRLFGRLHTRSRWARLGLDCVGSSTHLSPGFGGRNPIPLVLELVPRITIEVRQTDALAGLILFELDHPVRSSESDHALRFPLYEGLVK